MGKSSSKEEKKFNQLRQGIQQLEETMLIQNEKLHKLSNITQNLENKLNGIQKKMVEYENKLNQLEEKKEQLRDEMVQKTNLLVFQFDRQEQYIRENILIYGVEENKEDNDDGEKVLFKIAHELEIDLEDNELQSTSTRTKRRNNENPRPIIARFVSYKKRNEFLTNKHDSKILKTARLRLWRSHTSMVQATEVHAKILFWYVYLLLHSKWQFKS